MADLAALQVQLELQTAAFQAGVKQVDSRLKQMDRSVNKSNKGFLQMDKSLKTLKSSLGGIAGLMAGAFSINAVKGIIETNSQLAKTADTVGLTAEKFQAYSFAAERAGISTGQFSSNMTAFVKRVGEAQNGVGPLVSGLKNMDAALLENIKAAKGQDEAFQIVADAIKNAKTATERAAIANAAFSRSGVAMVKMLEEGAQGLAEMEATARSLGIIMEEDLVRSAEQYDDALSDLQKRIKATFGRGVLKTIKTVMDEAGLVLVAFAATVEKAWNNVAAGIEIAFVSIGAVVMTAIEAALAPVKSLLEFGGQFSDTVAGWGESVPAFGDAIGGAAEAIKQIRDEAEAANKVIDDAATATFRQAAAARQAADEAARMKREMREAFASGGVEVVDDLAGLSELLDDISSSMNAQVVAGQALGSAWEYATAGAEENLKKTKTLADELALGMQRFSQDFANGIVDGLAAGKLAMDDFAKDFLKMIAKIMLNNIVMDFLKAFGGSLTGSSNGFLSSIGSSISSTSRAIGGTTRTQSTMVAGQVKTPTLSAASHSRNGGGGVNITVNNSSSAKVETKQRQGPNGTEIEFMIEDAVSRQMGSGAYDKVMQSRFGVNRRGY